MSNMQNMLVRRNPINIHNGVLMILGLLTILIFLTFILQDGERNAGGQVQYTRLSTNLVCSSGDTQVTKYAGQVISMGCDCQAGYGIVTGDAPLGPVEWEVCK